METTDKIELFGIIAHNQCEHVEDLYKFTRDTFGEPKLHIAEAAVLAMDKACEMDDNFNDKLTTLTIVAMTGYKFYNEISANQIANVMTDLYARKNADYGNSFDESLDKFGIIAAMVRISDKVNRLKRLVINPKEAQVKDESIADTYIDLANYAVMTIMWKQNGK